MAKFQRLYDLTGKVTINYEIGYQLLLYQKQNFESSIKF